MSECYSAVVSNTSKVLKRKQITTKTGMVQVPFGCFQYIKGTKKKANHNSGRSETLLASVVSNTSKGKEELSRKH